MDNVPKKRRNEEIMVMEQCFGRGILPVPVEETQ